MWFERSTGEPVARGGLSRTVFDGPPELEVGWTTVPGALGRGLRDRARAGLCSTSRPGRSSSHDLVAFTLPHNGASRRVMEKLGFVYEKTAPYKVYGDHVLYRRR